MPRLSSLLLALLLAGCAPRAGVSPGPVSTPPVPDPLGAFLECVPAPTGGGQCRVGVGKSLARVAVQLEGTALELGAQPAGVTCAGVVGGVRCELGVVDALGVYRLPYLGALKTARAGFVRADGSSFSLTWP